MISKSFVMALLGSMLCAGVAFAQEEEPEQKLLRFEPAVRVILLTPAPEQTTTTDAAAVKSNKKVPDMLAKVPGATEAEPLQPYKAYPYGTSYEVREGVRFRINLSALTFAIARGPAKFTVLSDDVNQYVTVIMDQGDFNFSVDRNAVAGQFQVETPIGRFVAMSGMSKLHIGNPDALTEEDPFTFRAIDGQASFLLDYEKSAKDAEPIYSCKVDLDREEAFVAVRDPNVTSTDIIENSPFLQSPNVVSTVLTGKLGDVTLTIPISGNGKTTSMGISPGISVRVVSAVPRGSDNKAIFVLPLTPSTENYYGYVERRGEGFYGDRTVWEEGWKPAEEEGEDADGQDLADDDSLDEEEQLSNTEDELSDFDNDLF